MQFEFSLNFDVQKVQQKALQRKKSISLYLQKKKFKGFIEYKQTIEFCITKALWTSLVNKNCNFENDDPKDNKTFWLKKSNEFLEIVYEHFNVKSLRFFTNLREGGMAQYKTWAYFDYKGQYYMAADYY